MSAIVPMNANSDPHQRTIEVRLLNILYKIQEASATPFMPIPPQRIKPLPASSPRPLSAQVIHRLVEAVHPDSENKGEISIGSFHSSTRQFYNRLMDEMVGYGLGLEKDESPKLRQSVAHALGADSFKDLENAIVIEKLAVQREKLVESLAPVFAHIRDWFADHLNAASEDRKNFANNPDKSQGAENDIRVWTLMERAIQPVEAAINRAIRKGALDQNAVYYLGKQTSEREEALPGIKVWSAAAQGLLDAAQDVVKANLQTQPDNFELKRLMSVLTTAEKVCRVAEKAKPQGYPKSNSIPFDDHSWAGPAVYASASMAQPRFAN